MSKIICISNGTYREGINNIGDIVDIVDDDVELGPSYDTFNVIEVKASDGVISAAYIKEVLNAIAASNRIAKYMSKVNTIPAAILNNLKNGAYTIAQIEQWIENYIEANG